MNQRGPSGDTIVFFICVKISVLNYETKYIKKIVYEEKYEGKIFLEN